MEQARLTSPRFPADDQDMRKTPSTQRCRGSAMIMIVLLSIILTGLITVIAWTASAQAQTANTYTKLDRTFYAAEGAAQHVAWYIRNGKTGSISSPYSDTINGCTCTVTWTVNGSAYAITSKATYGGVTNTITITVTAPSSAPPVALGGDLDIKNFNITGDVAVAGNLSGSGTVTGKITYSGTDQSGGGVTGTTGTVHGSVTMPNMTTIGNTLTSNAGQTYNGSQSGKTFDFTGLGGKKVIVVNGSVTDPQFIGSGTLYVTGSVSFSSPNLTLGAANSPVNLVVGGSLAISKKAIVNGSIYVGGSFARAQLDMTGALFVAGSMVQGNNGQSSLTATSTPWFDDRASGGGGTLTTSNFGGVMP